MYYSILAAGLIIVGLLGFFWNPVFGIFHVNALHSIVHIASGMALTAGLFLRQTRKTASTLGVVYILMAVAGFMFTLDFLEIHSKMDPDNFLHLGLGIMFLLFTWPSEKSRDWRLD